MADRRPYGQLIPTQDGKYIQLYEDGSATIYDQQFNVVSDDPSPNPLRASLVAAGRDRDAAINAASTSLSSEDRSRFDAEQNLKKQQINYQYQVDLRNAKTNEQQQAATARYQDAQVQLSKDRLQFDRETQQQEFGLKQANLGYSLINTAANLSGPANYFAASNYARNTAAQPGTSTFLSALQNNTRLSGFGAQAGAPDAETLGTLTAKLTGQGNTGDGSGGATTTTGTGTTAAGAGTTATSGTISTGGATAGDNAYLNQIHGIAAQGAHRLNAGALEQLTPTEQKLFIAGLGAADENGKAYDPATFLDQYRRSRISQSLGLNRAA